MMNYKLVSHSNNGNITQVASSVLETKTGQYIATNLNNMEARSMIRYLNMGGGFDGNTPSFFLERIPKQTFSVSE
jgi:hypothetical protein